jgi:hypothetical protein
MRVFTPLLIVGGGPGALAAAEIASGHRLPSLVVGHVAGKSPDPEFPVGLDADAVAALAPHGVLDVLRPYLVVADPPTLSPHVFEDVLKQHCVADMNVTVYDGMEVVERQRSPGEAGLEAVLTDGRARWELSADAVIDTSAFPANLSDAVNRAADGVRAVLERTSAR